MIASKSNLRYIIIIIIMIIIIIIIIVKDHVISPNSRSSNVCLEFRNPAVMFSYDTMTGRES